ncbi:MAG: DUF1648 domain-containing protein [Cyclobacteriaceae bacterium]|nr:DUF1648 domain-containing protein [Cyclobacteriaceae bacterium]
MNEIFRKELVIFIVAILPIIFLFSVWDQMPDKLALHYDFKGEIDRWGSKQEIVPFAVLPLVINLVLLLVSKFKVKKSTENYYLVKLISVIVISFTILFMLYALINDSGDKANLSFLILGGITLVMACLMKSVKANHFIGIRTPWTLNNENVWRETHDFASKVFVISGLLIMILSLFLAKKPLSFAAFAIIAISVVTSLIYSFSSHKKNQI